jgi:hypothetical protein
MECPCFLLMLAATSAVASAQKPSLAEQRTSCAGRPAVDTTVHDYTGITELPIMREQKVFPRIPKAAWGSGVRDSALVGLVVNADGHPDSGSVIILHTAQSKYREAFDSVALVWALGLIFWPACNGTEPIRIRTAVPIHWRAPPFSR